MDKLITKLSEVKAQLQALPLDIQKLRDDAKRIQAELVLDGPRQSRSAELAKIQAQIAEKEELVNALESALEVVYHRLALSVEAESNAARQSILDEVPELQAKLDKAQARFQEAIDDVVDAGVEIFGTGARLKNRIDKAVKECIAGRAQVYQHDALSGLIWRADDRAEGASSFKYIMAEHGMEPRDIAKVIEVYQVLRQKQSEESTVEAAYA